MLLTERPRGVASRIKGRPALTKRLRLLLIAVHRFNTRRARSASDVMWSAQVMDLLTEAIGIAEHRRDATESDTR